AGGTLSGIGTIDAASVSITGVLAPGNAGTPAGTLHLAGSLTFASAAAYLITVNGAAVSKTAVTGATALNRASVDVANGSTVTTRMKYTILTAAGGVHGTFNPAVTYNGQPGLLFYDANDAYFCIKCAALSSLLPPNANRNERAIAAAIDGFIIRTG